MRERDGRERASAGGPDRGPPSKLRVVVDALGSIPERMRRPESLLMMLALLASIGVHMPPYLGLGMLADYFERLERDQKKAAEPPITFDVVSEPTPAPPPAPEKRAAKPEPERKRPEPEAAKPPPREQEKPKPEPEQKKVAAAQPLPEPKREERKQSITQKSDDPNVEPPPDAKYLAEENRRVEEESVASVTSETKNDPTLQAAAPQAAGPEHAGDSHEDERGAEKGAHDEREQRMASRERAPQPIAPRPPAPAEPTPQPVRPGRPQAAEPNPLPPSETIVRDPMGTFVLAPSNPRAGAGPRGPAGAATGANIKVSWRAFEQTFGAEQLAQDRMPKEARRRGAGREKRWEEFRAAIENYVVGVRPGNTTALNAAADPFAAYLAAFHRNLHMEFAHQFLSSLPMAGALGDPSLVTKVEIVVNADGSLDRVGVVKSSGNLMYDFGAFNAVQRGAPYPPTPEKIRSPDGRVYLRWALHRNESQCGTWNAEPYILRTPPRSPNDPKQDNVSPYRPGGGPAGGGEHGSAPRDEPRRGDPGKAPAVAPGETLGEFRRPGRTIAAG